MVVTSLVAGVAAVFFYFGWLVVVMEVGDLAAVGFVVTGYRFCEARVEELGRVFLRLVA